MRRWGIAIGVMLLSCALPLSIVGMEVALGLLALMLLLGPRSEIAALRHLPLLLPLLVLYAGFVLSGLLSSEQLASLRALDWSVLAYPVLYWGLAERPLRRRSVALYLLVGAVVSLYGILQHFTGVDWARPGQPDRAFLVPGSPDRYLVFGTFSHHLTFAHAWLTLLALFTGYLLCSARTPRVRLRGRLGFAAGTGTALGGSGRLLAAAGTGSATLALLYTYARGAWLAAGAALALSLLLWRGRRAIRAIAAVALAVALLMAVSPSLRYRARTIASAGYNRERLMIWQSNWDIIRDHPLFGVGLGEYPLVRDRYYDRYPLGPEAPRAHAHNAFLQVWINGGLLALGGYVALLAGLLRRCWRTFRALPPGEEHGRMLAYAGFMGGIAFLVGGLSQNNLGDTEVAIAFWYLMALAARAETHGEGT